MNTTPIKNTHDNSAVTSMVAGIVVSLALFMSSPGAASAQELFALSTEAGLELYQIETLIMPSLLINPHHSVRGPNTATKSFSNGPLRSTYGTIGTPLMVQSGLQTTPYGRLTIASRSDSQPTAGDNAHEENFVASLMLEQTQSHLIRE